jgi:hypothetical protein
MGIPKGYKYQNKPRSGGRPRELEEPSRLTFWVDKKQLTEWRAAAKEMNLTMGSLLRAAVQEYLEDA